MKKIVLCENQHGIIYQVQTIPNTMFNFYILKGRQFSDLTNNYKICVEFAADTNKFLVLDTIRGSEQDAIARLDELIETGE